MWARSATFGPTLHGFHRADRARGEDGCTPTPCAKAPTSPPFPPTTEKQVEISPLPSQGPKVERCRFRSAPFDYLTSHAWR